ncbi:hypothetical protein [Nitrococcus mobilis]|uniref:Uncharacterized protein n=1 Tax=Nitrococcus mobilis Nb-231 TaxID=314278 RepID=A4BKZ3_9GAMM|nr:hypothetical protein [Nitrococcus mobilis]EAR22981.1 hypothetical protein NB231_14213 [Nitrococcus mobilis Nb-231]
MTDDSLIIKHLQAIRAILGEHGERLERIETRLSSIEHTVGFIYAGAGDDRATMQGLARRVERIERRLELREGDD